MRLVLLAAGLAVLSAGICSLHTAAPQVVILSGDIQGYLSPCGCSTPMLGGIRRMAGVVRGLEASGHSTLLENGGMVTGLGRQDEMKAETLVQTLADLDVASINIGPDDARLGPGEILQLSQLAGGKLSSLCVADPEAHSLGTAAPSGPFLVGGATDYGYAVASVLDSTPIPLDAAVQSLVDEADAERLAPVLMLQGSHDSAARLARRFPKLALIQYSSIGDPPSKLERVGDTVLATTGERGKRIVALTYANGRFEQYRVISLGPEYRDDPVASRFYAAYLRRVTDEKLLEKLPRAKSALYAGSSRCV
ncbi:MAG TPA: hypothetical protein VMI31_03125, partial [Fimbriimonadaceae bacterium]|nr:hypothetical protein [Fimbriimonadaceae bacterium]